MEAQAELANEPFTITDGQEYPRQNRLVLAFREVSRRTRPDARVEFAKLGTSRGMGAARRGAADADSEGP